MTLFEPMKLASLNGDEYEVCLYFPHFSAAPPPDLGPKIGKETCISKLAKAKLATAPTIEGIRNLQSSRNSMLTTQR